MISVVVDVFTNNIFYSLWIITPNKGERESIALAAIRSTNHFFRKLIPQKKYKGLDSQLYCLLHVLIPFVPKSHITIEAVINMYGIFIVKSTAPAKGRILYY